MKDALFWLKKKFPLVYFFKLFFWLHCPFLLCFEAFAEEGSSLPEGPWVFHRAFCLDTSADPAFGAGRMETLPFEKVSLFLHHTFFPTSPTFPPAPAEEGKKTASRKKKTSTTLNASPHHSWNLPSSFSLPPQVESYSTEHNLLLDWGKGPEGLCSMTDDDPKHLLLEFFKSTPLHRLPSSMRKQKEAVEKVKASSIAEKAKKSPSSKPPRTKNKGQKESRPL